MASLGKQHTTLMYVQGCDKDFCVCFCPQIHGSPMSGLSLRHHFFLSMYTMAFRDRDIQSKWLLFNAGATVQTSYLLFVLWRRLKQTFYAYDTHMAHRNRSCDCMNINTHAHTKKIHFFWTYFHFWQRNRLTYCLLRLGQNRTTEA